LNARFYEGSNPSQRIPGGSGPWSLFKLIEQGTLTKKDDTTFELRLARDPYYAVLRLRPTSRVNPLVLYHSKALQNFRCGR
jgi:type VI protein secretion system component VasK